MIDVKHLRESPELYKAAAKLKRVSVDIDAFLELDEEYRKQRGAFEELRSKQNKFNKELKKLQGAEKEAKLDEMKQVAAAVKEESQALKEKEEEWKTIQLRIPSLPLAEVPDGADDTENVEVRLWGDVPSFSFAPKDHVELGTSLGIMDIERGVKIAGARNYFLKGDGARLQDAIMRYAIDLLHERGYTLFDPPIVVRYMAMTGTGYFPGSEDQAYHLDERDDEMYLIGTSEVSVCAYHADEILKEEELPKRYAGFSPCFRREAGTYGKDTHGLYRVHQFHKVEQVIISKSDPEESARLHAELLKNAEDVMQALGLAYRVVNVCGGDLGLGQVFKNDIETWMPSREAYGETHSCSTFHDFQARRLNMRYKNADGDKVFCHTLNNTCVASPRILIPLLEQHQQEDGTVRIPEVLRPYMKGQEALRPAE